ncbi:hypothetical protein FRX31_021089 [Thalictrum thalictroides]|uniref:Uncharacterized protein n=1 Tax=Thalictrum thalictroides TaxID=46969 RepID=A0A7J6VW39_THATH|nr:hypothetical protein FRX31_021089 [Thalictrum thalictroides]
MDGGRVMGGGGSKKNLVGDGQILEMVEDSEEEELQNKRMEERVTEVFNNQPMLSAEEKRKRINKAYNNLNEDAKNQARRLLCMEEKRLKPSEPPRSLPLTPK